MGFDVEALLRAHAEAYLPDVTPLVQALLQASAKSDREQGERLENWALCARRGAHASAWPHLESVFMTKDGNPRKRLVTAAFAAAYAPKAEALIHQSADVAVLRNRLNAVQTLALTGDIYRFAADLITAYEAAKTSLGVLDYDDLIVYTNRLLSSRSATQWVLFKIDRGLEHILVDEAQIPAQPNGRSLPLWRRSFLPVMPPMPSHELSSPSEMKSSRSTVFRGLIRQALKKCEHIFLRKRMLGVAR